MALSAYEYMLQYRMMKVPLIDGTAIYDVDVHEYRNAADYFSKTGSDSISSDHDVDQGMAAYQKLKNAIIKNSQKLGSLKYRCSFEVGSNGQAKTTFVEEVDLAQLMACYIGKGSPQEVQQALRLAQAFGFIKRDVASMKTYVEKNLGIDCSGFVTNYLQKVHGLALKPSEVNSIKYRSLGSKVASLDDVSGDDVIAWAGTNHVAIINTSEFAYNYDDKQNLKSLYCFVIESTGADAISGDVHSDGLMGTYYFVLPPDKNGIFKVARSTGWEQAGGKWNDDQWSQKKTWKVHIRRLL
jgi:hypothetical protein